MGVEAERVGTPLWGTPPCGGPPWVWGGCSSITWGGCGAPGCGGGAAGSPVCTWACGEEESVSAQWVQGGGKAQRNVGRQYLGDVGHVGVAVLQLLVSVDGIDGSRLREAGLRGLGTRAWRDGGRCGCQRRGRVVQVGLLLRAAQVRRLPSLVLGDRDWRELRSRRQTRSTLTRGGPLVPAQDWERHAGPASGCRWVWWQAAAGGGAAGWRGGGRTGGRWL